MPADAGNRDALLLREERLLGSVAPPQMGQERGRYGLVVEQQFRLGKAVVRKHHLRRVSLNDLPSTSTTFD